MTALITTVLVVGLSILMAGAIALVVVLDGFVLSCLWAWFVVPYFGVQTLSVPFAIGLMLVVRKIWPRHEPMTTDNRTKKEKWVAALSPIVNPLWALLIGWVASMFL
jgi:hypothetical protein